MELNTQDYMKKALLDAQEQVRDYMYYAEQAEDPKLRRFFRDCALHSGESAQSLRDFLTQDVT